MCVVVSLQECFTGMRVGWVVTHSRELLVVLPADQPHVKSRWVQSYTPDRIACTAGLVDHHLCVVGSLYACFTWVLVGWMATHSRQLLVVLPQGKVPQVIIT
jgi:hypothetical protein